MRKMVGKGMVLTVFCLISTHIAWGQNPTNTRPLKRMPESCEFNNIALEQAQIAAEGTIVILIARAGIVDKNPNSSERRLHTARAYLVEYTKLTKPEHIVTAIASKNKDLYYGGVEIYVKGKLHDIVTSMPDKALSVGTCSGMEPKDKEFKERLRMLYPWLH